MELTELQNMWLANDQRIKKSLKINREILNRILQTKTQKRITRIKIEATLEIVLPIIGVAVFLLPNVEIRYDFWFYLGNLLFWSFFVTTYIWAIQYFRLVHKIDFQQSVFILKKQVAELEKNKLKFKRFGSFLAPAAIAGIFLMMEFPIFSTHSIWPFLPLGLIIIIFAGSTYVSFKYSIKERFRKLNSEIAEIEQLLAE